MVLDFDKLPKVRTLKRSNARAAPSAAGKQVARNKPKNQLRMPGQKQKNNNNASRPYGNLTPS